MKIVRYLKYFLTKRKEIVFFLQEYSSYMKNGTYYLRPNFAYHTNSEPLWNVQLNYILQILFLSKIRLYSNTKVFYATSILINAKKEVKLFSSKEVLTFSSEKEQKALFDIYKKIELYFAYPPILKREKHYYVESFISDNGMKNIVDIKSIYYQLINYYKHIQPKIEKIQIEKLQQRRFSSENYTFIQSLINSTIYPFIESHNDIHFGNILKQKDKLYIIDWEYYGYNLFFYDFINIFFIEGLKGDKKYLKAFLKGELDTEFNILFELFGCSYKKQNRIQYIDAYLLQKIIIRDLCEDDNHLNSVIEKYRKMKENCC